eukprot:12412388-Karenia_brevis.AAC.1
MRFKYNSCPKPMLSKQSIMKRASAISCVSPSCKRNNVNRACLIKLNVGGQFFDVSPETLSGAEFFEPLLAERIPYAVDDTDRIFIDRNGNLFGHLLQFLRTCTRPSQKVIESCGEELLNECKFYGVEWLAQHIRGEISPFDLRPADQNIRKQEEEAYFN